MNEVCEAECVLSLLGGTRYKFFVYSMCDNNEEYAYVVRHGPCPAFNE